MKTSNLCCVPIPTSPALKIRLCIDKVYALKGPGDPYALAQESHLPSGAQMQYISLYCSSIPKSFLVGVDLRHLLNEQKAAHVSRSKSVRSGDRCEI